MPTNLYPILILIFIPSLEELKDLNDKPELMKLFVSKDESVSYSSLQSRQVKHTPQDSINELIIWKMNPVVVSVTSVKFKSAFLHA